MRDKTHPAHILIIEDEIDFAESLKTELKDEFELVDSILTCSGVISQITRSPALYDVLIVDQNLSDGPNGLECLREIRRINSNLEVIILTGYGERKLAIEALRDGAFRYLYKPPNIDELIATIYLAYNLVRLRSTNKELVRERYEFRSSAIKSIIISCIALISILLIAIAVRDRFIPVAIAFFAMICILFAGWQGFRKFIFKWDSKEEKASFEIETIQNRLQDEKTLD